MTATRWAVGAILMAAGCGVVTENGASTGAPPETEGTGSGAAALTAGTGANPSGSSAVFFVENAIWADIHYRVNGGQQLNVRMSVTGTHNEYTLANLTNGTTVNYNFTYFDLGCSCAHDSDPAVYVHGGTGTTTGGGTTGGTTGGPVVDPPQGAQPYPARTIPRVPTTGGTNLSGTVTPLFGSGTPLEPASVVDTPSALVTRVGDRVRDRHARESQFHIYEHFLPLYFKDRTYVVEVVDSIAKGGSTITINLKTQSPQDKPNIRAFFRGITTVAEYFSNEDFTKVSDTSYTSTLSYNAKEGRAIRVGDRMEMEVGIFLAPPFEGRFNYYSSVFLYVVGTGGIQPFEGRGSNLDSFPLPSAALTGGGTTLNAPYSNEPNLSFMQMATNMAGQSAQPWVEGRRLLHTDFVTGVHSEPENPDFAEQANKVGPSFVATRCVSCHANNGRALPPPLNTTLTSYAMKVGVVSRDGATASPHPSLGSVVQPMSRTGAPEGTAQIRAWLTQTGALADGTPFELRAPSYSGTGPLPAAYSARITPQIIGAGLLEAVPESAVAAKVDVNDANGDGVSGRMQVVTDSTGKARMGRFGWKAAQPTVVAQIASALNREMGVKTSVFPTLDCGSAQAPAACTSAATPMTDADLAKLGRYNALLGVPARKAVDDATALAGEALFVSTGCAGCHTTTFTTSAFHPNAELRGQTIHAYTDLLLHDMGEGLADNLPEGAASGAEWRTAPLWGIGHTADVSGGEAYLHDGRARTLTEAILWHGGEGERAKAAFAALSAAQRNAILTFLKTL